MTHYHGYRRDCQVQQTGKFVTEPPPEIIRDNLRSHDVKPRTWSDPEPVIEWLTGQMKPALDYLMWPQHNPPIDEIVATREESLRGELQRGGDVVWAEWLKGNRYLHFAVICCPGGINCPTGR